MIKISLVDDHAVVRAGYRLFLENQPGLEIVAEYDSGEAAVRDFSTIDADIVLLDQTLPAMTGIDAMKRMLAKRANAKILFVSMHEESSFVDLAMSSGARGFVGKRSERATVVDAIRKIAKGETYIDPRLAKTIVVDRMAKKTTPFDELTGREFEVCCLIAEGKGTADIAKALSLSPKTVSNYTTQVKLKLNAESTTEVARLALRHGIVEL